MSSQRCTCSSTSTTATPSFDNRWNHLNNHNNNNPGLTQMHIGDLLCDKQQCKHHQQLPQQKRPLRRGSLRSSSFGGVGNRRGSAPVDAPLSQRSGCGESLPKEWMKKYNANSFGGKKRATNKNGLYLVCSNYNVLLLCGGLALPSTGDLFLALLARGSGPTLSLGMGCSRV